MRKVWNRTVKAVNKDVLVHQAELEKVISCSSRKKSFRPILIRCNWYLNNDSVGLAIFRKAANVVENAYNVSLEKQYSYFKRCWLFS